jgi:hypothetical protein
VVKTIPYALLAYGALVSFSFLWCWDKTYRATLSKALVAIANVGFGGIKGHGAVHPLRFLRSVDESVKGWTARNLQSSERVMVYSINRAAEPFLLIVGATLAIGLSLYELAKYVAHLSGKAITRVEHTTVIKKVGEATKVITSVTKAQFNHLTARVRTVERKVTRALHATAGAIATPFPRIGRLEKTAKAQAKRLTRLEKRVFGAVAAGFGVAILAKTVISWLRCPSLQRATKGRNCIDFDFLDALLTGALLIVGTISLVEFAEEVQSVTEEASGLIHGFLRDA